MSRGYVPILELGRGGMGDVLLAVASGPGGVNKLHVVKRLRRELAKNEQFLTMFFNEARIAARIDHPNVVQTYEVGFDGEHHYSAMEYLEGQSLEALFNRGGTSVAPEIYLAIICDALSGLHHAHELTDLDGRPLGIVHRDVSPQNIFVTYDGEAKLLDFGIAKAVDVEATRSGGVKGKMAYMPLEQVERGPKFDRRADLFAVGAILFRIITGQRLWKGMTDVEIYMQLAEQGAPSPRSVRPDAPAELVAICERALARDPDDRFSTALELQQAIEAYLARMGAMVMPRQVGALVAELFAEDRARVSAKIAARFAQGVSSEWAVEAIPSSEERPPQIPAFGVPFDSEGKLMSADLLEPTSVRPRVDLPAGAAGGPPTARVEPPPRAPLSTDITAPVSLLTEANAEMLLVDMGWPAEDDDGPKGQPEAPKPAGNVEPVWPTGGGALATVPLPKFGVGRVSAGPSSEGTGKRPSGAGKRPSGAGKGPSGEWVRAWAVPAVAAFALAAVFLVLKSTGFFSSEPQVLSERPATTAAPPDSAAAPAPATAAAAGPLVLQIVATPPNARVLVDKRPLELGKVTYSQGDARHHVSVEAPGHQPYADWVVLREPKTTLRVTLKPFPPRGKPQAADVVREEGPG